ncbi:MAG: chain-length determining protein [Prevotella sp.]|nr:chain-length determining protein [Prevotella sp.]
MEENSKQIEVINLKEVIKKIIANKKDFYLPLAIVFVLSCIYIFSKPRYYQTDAKIAPEMSNSMAGGALGSLAASFGFDINDMQTSDAINPLLYPDLLEDNAFVASMFNIQVETSEKDIKTSYYDYLKKHQKKAWWSPPISWFKNLLSFKKKTSNSGKGEFNPYILSEDQNKIVKKIQDNITISVDTKTGVLTIDVKDQDARICKTLTDSVMQRLQDFITEYRTSKARTDYEYYKRLATDAKKEYEKARQKYGSMSDANSKITLRSIELKVEDMENDMQLKYNTYTSLNAQLQAANAKVQERTPVFTVLKGAAMPIKPAGPKRMIFIAAMLILTFIAKAFWMIKDDLHLRF